MENADPSGRTRLIVPISTSGVPFVVNDGGQGANWKQGDVIEARVTGVFSSGVARLSTQGASFDLTLPVKVSIGDTVRLKLEGHGEALRFVFVDAKPGPSARGAGSPPLTQAGPAASTSAGIAHLSGAEVGAPKDGLSGQNNAAQAVGASITAFAAIAHQILPVLAGRQDSIAALFANLRALSSEQASALPREIQHSLRTVAAHALQPDQSLDAGTLKQKALASGTFWEAGLIAPSPSKSPGDLKAQLLFLKGALAGFLGKEVQPRAVADKAPPPPRAGAYPTGQSARNPTIVPAMNAAQVATILQADVEAALSRLRLLQIASLGSSEEGHFQRHVPDQPEWRFEIPILFQGQTAVAEFRISKDGGSGGDENGPEHHWRLQFSVDVPDTGRIDALVGLHGDRISVGLWSERPDMARRLSSEAGDLRAALEDAGLAVDEISVAEGAPTVAAARSGYFVDWTA